MQVLTKRGKRLQKHYTVFICKLDPAEKESYQPQLNEEHSQWKWIHVDELRSRTDVHPVVHLVLHDHWEQSRPMIEGS